MPKSHRLYQQALPCLLPGMHPCLIHPTGRQSIFFFYLTAALFDLSWYVGRCTHRGVERCAHHSAHTSCPTSVVSAVISVGIQCVRSEKSLGFSGPLFTHLPNEEVEPYQSQSPPSSHRCLSHHPHPPGLELFLFPITLGRRISSSKK